MHLIARQLFDLSSDLAAIGNLDKPFPIAANKADEIRSGGGTDQQAAQPPLKKPRDIYIPDLHIDSIKVKTRDFR